MFQKHRFQYKQIIRTLLTPDDLYDRVEDIPLDQLYQNDIQTLLIDVDNTLMTYQQREIGLQNAQWIETAKSFDMQVLFISNNSSRKRILRVCKQCDVDGIYFALKPFPFACRDLMADYNVNPKHTAIIGDQLFKDVILGNWLNLHTILVNPIDIRRSFIKTMQRDIEVGILDRLNTL